ncbi:hypothetical protein [Vibrio alfacsensis]|uniref:hypothetical protein n=1 Tax=Vibrio TaxID=662 RepID=UPI0040675CD9
MKNSEYLKAKKEVVCKLKSNGIDAEQLGDEDLTALIAQHIEEKNDASDLRIIASIIGLCLGLWI